MSLNTGVHNCWLSSTADSCVTKRLEEDLEVHQLGINYVYRQFCAIFARQGSHDCKIPKADDAEVTVSTHVLNDDKPYRPTNSRSERDDELPF